MKKKKIELRIIIYIAIIVAIVALALVFFFISKEYKTICTSYNVEIIKCKNALENLTEGTPEYEAMLAKMNNFQGLKDKAALTYNIFAYLAYGFSIAFLVSVGLIIAHSSKVKEKRDNAVAAA